MGCCSSSDAAGDKKPGKHHHHHNKVVAVPDLVVESSAELTLERQVLKATYGPKDQAVDIDVTDKLRALFTAGTKTIAAGAIESTLGLTHHDHQNEATNEPTLEGVVEPAPAEGKVLSVYYISTTPDGEWEDFDNVKFDTSKTVMFASYGIDAPKDVTVQVNELIAKLKAEGKTEVVGGIHTPLKEALPMDPNKFKIWYA